MFRKPSFKMLLMLSGLLCLGWVSSQCTEGCVKCGTDSSGAVACQICDLFSSFYMDSDNKCVRRVIENCLIPSSDQNEYLCAQCKMGYLLDAQQVKCVEVPSSQKIDNCRQYTLVGTCKHCYQHYYLEGNECKKVGVIIENCRTYFGNDLCEECVDNYYFDVKTNQCISFDPIDNCASHTFKKCRSCQDGFYPNSNAGYLSTVDNAMAQRTAIDLWEAVNFAKTWVSTCVANTDENCLEMESSPASGKLTNLCKTCMQGYYLESGVCKKNPGWAIKECKTYSTPQVCTECNTGFYLDCNECKQRSEYASCETPNISKDQCYKCLATHYLGSNNTCQLRTNGAIAQCSVYNRTKDYCDTCNTDFMRTNDFLECFPEIKNCDTYNLPAYKTDTKMTCKTCDTNYYLTEDKSECNPQNVVNCETYENNSSNKCQTCEDGYYYDAANNLCQEQNIANCEKFESNINVCKNCKDFFRNDSGTSCVGFTIPDCIQNDLNQENCKTCIPHRYLLEVNHIKICKEVVNSLEVDDCLNSSSISDSYGCSVCDKFDQAPLSISGFKHKKALPTNCASVDADEKCTNCKNDMDMVVNADDEATCTNAVDLTVACLNLKNKQTTNLSANDGNCDSCRNYETHYGKDNMCFRRTTNYSQNCQSHEKNKEGCLVCKESFSAKESTAKDGPVCLLNPTGFTTMTGCAIYNVWDHTKCVKCEWEYSLTGDGMCVLTSNRNMDMFVKNDYDRMAKNIGLTKFNFKSNTHTVGGMTNSSNDQIYFSEECKDGFVKVFTDKKLGYNYKTKGIFADTYFVSCQRDTNWAQKDDGNGGKIPYVTGADCDLAISHLSTLYCVKCKNNMNAKYVSALYDKDGNQAPATQSASIATVENCTTTNDTVILTKKYKALGFRKNGENNKRDYFEEEIFYDTCPNPNDNLVVVLSQSSNVYHMFRVELGQNQGEERAFCYDFGSNPPVQNCHVFGTEYQSTGFNYRTGTIRCIACKPGFAPTLDDNSDVRLIFACNKIENCDTSNDATNTWMNACETCDSDSVYLQEGPTNNFLDISTCKTRTKTNCLVENSSDECIVCDVGFTVNAGACDSKTVSNCTKQSYSPDQVTYIDNTYTMKHMHSFGAYLQNKFESVSAREGCFECISDHSLFGLPHEGSEFRCESNQSMPNNGADLVADCKLFSGQAADDCFECLDTHIKTTDNKCVAKSSLDSTVSIDNCSVLDQTVTPNVCDTCASLSYKNADNNKCVKYASCIEYEKDVDQVVCKNCEDGKMRDFRDKTLCIDIIYTNCLQVRNDVCHECKPGYSKMVKNHNTYDQRVECVENSFDDPNMANLIYTFSSNNSDLNGVDIALKPDDKDHYMSTNKADVHTNQICPYHMDPKCDSEQNLQCLKCADNHYKIMTNVCVPISIENCIDQKNLYECNECKTGYYTNSLNQCQKQNVDDCETYFTDKAGCQKCKSGNYSLNGNCEPHTVTNCTLYSETENKCTECNQYFYVKDGKCEAHTVKGCRKYHKTSDECIDCPANHYFTNKDCFIVTAKNCKRFPILENKCVECFTESSTSHVNNFILDEESIHCIPMEEIKGCNSYELTGANRGDCKSCTDGYFYHENECLPYPTGVRFCAEFTTPTACLRCIDDYYLDTASGSCMPVYKPIMNCMEHATATDCKVCKTGYMLSTDAKSCIMTTGTHCKTFATFDSCASCEEWMGLEETLYTSSDGTNKIKTCASTITNCLKATQEISESSYTDLQGGSVVTKSYTYKCEKCSQGLVLNENKTSCDDPVVISHCVDYSEDGLCSMCHFGYWLAKDKKSCIHDNLLSSYGCKDAYIGDTITCNACKQGYMMDTNGECVECGGTGCAVCSADSSASCSLCGPGYYMTSSNTCSKNENFSFTMTKEEITGGDSANKTSSKVISADDGRSEDGENFGMKISALVLGLITLLVGLA